ncbi:MAG: hypothetical protein ACR2P8_12040, partial [Myxococcota bacterium]
MLLLLSFALGCSETDRMRWQARFGSESAQLELGQRLIEGEGAERDVEDGLGWLEKAAEAGSRPAQKKLVTFYGDRRLGDDLERVERWLRAAAASGDVES